MPSNINVIFPMAGDGTRFGGIEFKPFIDGTEKLFIELAKEPLNSLKDKYSPSFYFIFNEHGFKNIKRCIFYQVIPRITVFRFICNY